MAGGLATVARNFAAVGGSSAAVAGGFAILAGGFAILAGMRLPQRNSCLTVESASASRKQRMKRVYKGMQLKFSKGTSLLTCSLLDYAHKL